MTPQLKAFWVFLVAAVLVIAFFLWVALSTHHAREMDPTLARRVRVRFFCTLSLVLSVILLLTVPHMPYPVSGQSPDRVVFVVGKQFAFGISDQPITNDAEWETATYSAPVELPAEKLIEFRVSSFDVNHGFGIYSPSGTLIAQVQAMPGYVNRLRMRFDETGTYNVFCMELCGIDHHRMHGVLHVVPKQIADESNSSDGLKRDAPSPRWPVIHDNPFRIAAGNSRNPSPR